MKFKNKIFLFLIHLILNGGGLYIGITKIFESINHSISVINFLSIFIGVSIVQIMFMDKKINKKLEDKTVIILAIIFPIVIYTICYFNNGKFVPATIGIIATTISFYLYSKIDYYFKKSL